MTNDESAPAPRERYEGSAHWNGVDMTKAIHDADAARLIELYDAKWRIVSVNARRTREGNLTGRDVDAAMAAGDRLDEACEAFRRKHYPRVGQVIAAGGMVFTASPKRLRTRVVFDSQAARLA